MRSLLIFLHEFYVCLKFPKIDTLYQIIKGSFFPSFLSLILFLKHLLYLCYAPILSLYGALNEPWLNRDVIYKDTNPGIIITTG